VTRYWRRNLELIAGLLAVWFGVTFGIAYFAQELSFEFFGWPFSFWVASQGAIFVFLLIVAVYTWRMDRLDADVGAAGTADRD
jgi:putative solute:sodium symporter small subunit